ncbi:glycosyltransferase family 39 protein, partial [bacterium]|nr:glycosyltransferase family 39 protein [bacterium]
MNLDRPNIIQRCGFTALAFFIYVLAAIIFTWPLITDLHGRVLGYIGFENTAQTLWIFHAWCTYQSDVLRDLLTQYGPWGLLAHIGEWYHLCMCFPERNSVANGLDFFWTWPLYKLCGFPDYYNVKCLIILALNGTAAYILGRSYIKSRLAALIAGFFYAFNPYHFYLLITGRIIEAQTFVPILAICVLLKAWDKDSLGYWAAAGAMLGLTADNYWFYGHFTIIFTVVFLLYKICRRQPPKLGPSWRNLVFYLLAFLVLVMPFAHPYLIRLAIGQRIPGMVRPDPQNSQSMTSLTRQMIAFSAEADYPIKQQTQGSTSPFTSPWWGPWQCTFLANAVILGVLPALLWRRFSFWLIGAFVFYFLPLGPFLKYGGTLVNVHDNAIALPYLYLIQYFPLLAKLFWPNQSMYLFAICLAMLIGTNMDSLIERKSWFGSRLIQITLGALLLTIPVMEMRSRHQLPLPQDAITIPPLYVNEGWQQGYIYLPLGRRYWERLGDFNRDYYHGADVTIVDLHLAMHHGKGMFGRPHYMAHKDYWLYHPYNLSTHPYLRWLVALGVRPSPEFSAQDQQQITDEGYRYLAVHERICCHLDLEQTNATDLEGGARIFDTICA